MALILGQGIDVLQRFLVSSALPVLHQLTAMQLGPLVRESEGPFRKGSLQKLQSLDCDLRRRALHNAHGNAELHALGSTSQPSFRRSCSREAWTRVFHSSASGGTWEERKRERSFRDHPFNRSGTPPGTAGSILGGTQARGGAGRWEPMQDNEQTRLGRFFERHPWLLRSLAVVALLWGLGYLTWRIGWSAEGSSPVLFAMLLATEIYGLWGLAALTWFSWRRRAAVRPSPTPGRSVDVYVCTYDEPVEVVAATLAGCRALTYPHTTWTGSSSGQTEQI